MMSAKIMFERLQKNGLEARLAYQRAQESLACIGDIVQRSRSAVESSHQLMQAIENSNRAPRFSAANRCGEELAFLLGDCAADELPNLDRLMIFLICENLDEIAVWFGNYHARLAFDAALAEFALAHQPAVLN